MKVHRVQLRHKIKNVQRNLLESGDVDWQTKAVPASSLDVPSYQTTSLKMKENHKGSLALLLQPSTGQHTLLN